MPTILKNIYFFTEDLKFTLKNKTAIRRWLRATIKNEGFTIEEINYIFCSDKFLLSLNKNYLHHDTFTDIITFNYTSFEKSRNDKKLSGDIFISVDRVRENACLFKSSFSSELHRIMIHGVLHLAGHDDKTKKDKKFMTSKEDFYLKRRKF
jgi:probable rRNA maturation factor